MSFHTVTAHWARNDADFLHGKYSREHTWTFDGGMVIPASPSPVNVPPPYSNPTCVDPEEALVAAASSCHLLTFLYLACQHGFQVESYRDEAVGTLGQTESGSRWMNTITLRPRITYGGTKIPTTDEEAHLHRLAHKECIIANSIKTPIAIE
ncbi:MAG TPA: OsmC family protein [Chthoniobacterales bacterium]